MDASATPPTTPATTNPNPQTGPVPAGAPAEIGPPGKARRPYSPPPPPSGPVKVRGATSVGSLFTGALVAWAAVVLFALIARSAASYAGYKPAVLAIGGARDAGVLTAVAIGLGIGLAFLWGGYSAGRMSRGRGWAHGLTVAILAAITAGLGIGLAALVRPGPGLHLGLHLPAGYPRVHFLMSRWLAAAIGGALALLSAIAGGALGTGWHGRLERRAAVEEQERVTARESFSDLREALAHPEPIGHDEAGGGAPGTRPNAFPGSGTPSPGVTG
ncbi:MAG TPA: hypothetical protein VHA57_03745 [Actinomycetota bacterium]|nr:hypothetical protein [Actinomycetota bacterium]